MAVTKIHAIKSTVNKSLAYIMNEKKTQGRLLVSGFRCVPETAEIDFYITEKVTAAHAKKNPGKIGGADVRAYHIMQSFPRNEKVTTEQAHDIGQELAADFLQGKYEYVIATHVDKKHIHNHIIFNAYSPDETKKYRSEPYKTAAKLRDASDRICSKYGLHVIENELGTGQHYKEWTERKKGTSWKAEIEKQIKAIIPTVSSYEEFKESINGIGIEIDDESGKYIKYRAQGQERWIRANGKSLSLEYSKESIVDKIYAAELAGLSHITINQKLIISQSENNYYTRIPYTSQYVNFESENSTWYKNKATLSTFIYPENEYDIYDRQGKAIKTIKGVELSAFYTVKERPKARTESGKLYKGNVSKRSREAMQLYRKLKYMAKVKHLANINDIAQAMRVIHQEGIRSYTELEKRIEENSRLTQKIKAESAETTAALKEAVGNKQYIEVYIKNAQTAQSVFDAEPERQGQLRQKFERQISAFEHAQTALTKKGIDVNEKTLDEYEKKTATLREQQTATQERVKQLENQGKWLNEVTNAINLTFEITREEKGDEKQKTRRKRTR